MNSRFIPITTAIISLSIAVFFIEYFDSLWRWIIASPLLVFVTWPSIKIGLFSSQAVVDKMTGVDKFYDNTTASGHNEHDRVWSGILRINRARLDGFYDLTIMDDNWGSTKLN